MASASRGTPAPLSPDDADRGKTPGGSTPGGVTSGSASPATGPGGTAPAGAGTTAGGGPAKPVPARPVARPAPKPAADSQPLLPLGPIHIIEPPSDSLEAQLLREAYAFDFFQAVRLLERVFPTRAPIGRFSPPTGEIIRLRAHLSLNFPPSQIFDIVPSADDRPAAMFVAFFGLTGPSGMLPRHYTEMLLRLERDVRGPERYALRDWIDLFNHRLLSLFYRSWEKYRFFIPYERKEYAKPEPDTFSLALYSLIGLGMPAARHQNRLSLWQVKDDQVSEQVLTRIDDLSLFYFSGFFSHRPRCAISLARMLSEYFQLPFAISQFQGQWLLLDELNQSRMGDGECNNQLGVTAISGERVWDTQSKIRVRIGPLSLKKFHEFLPDTEPSPLRKAFFALSHLVRFYVGPELDFDVQLVLRAEDVPASRLPEGALGGSRLGWDSWCLSLPFPTDADDPVFEGDDRRALNDPDAALREAGFVVEP